MLCCLQERLPVLAPAFKSNHSPRDLIGSDKGVQAAIQKNGFKTLKHIVKSLTLGGHVHTLLFHWFGNYTLQDLVAASSKLRTAAVAALHKAQVQASRSASSPVDLCCTACTSQEDQVCADKLMTWAVAIQRPKWLSHQPAWFQYKAQHGCVRYFSNRLEL